MSSGSSCHPSGRAITTSMPRRAAASAADTGTAVGSAFGCQAQVSTKRLPCGSGRSFSRSVRASPSSWHGWRRADSRLITGTVAWRANPFTTSSRRASAHVGALGNARTRARPRSATGLAPPRRRARRCSPSMTTPSRCSIAHEPLPGSSVTACPPCFSIATSNEVRVRSDGSKNTIDSTLPASEPAAAPFFRAAARSSRARIASSGHASAAMKSRFVMVPVPPSDAATKVAACSSSSTSGGSNRSTRASSALPTRMRRSYSACCTGFAGRSRTTPSSRPRPVTRSTPRTPASASRSDPLHPDRGAPAGPPRTSSADVACAAAHGTGPPPNVVPSSPASTAAADALRHQHRAHRQPRRDSLRQREHVGVDADRLRGRERAGPPATALHLVEDQHRAGGVAGAARGASSVSS